MLETQIEDTSIKNELFGYTKLTDFIASGKRVLMEQSKFMAVKVTHDYDLVEHLQTGRFGLTSNATVIVGYSVEYAFGFDLNPGSFELMATPAGIEIRLGKPILVASPAVTPLRYQIADRGFLTDEKAAVIAIQQRLPAIARNKGLTMAQEELIRAACEKTLVEFLRDFMGKQPGVRYVPNIIVVYK